MNVDQRKSFRIQLTEGREQGTLFLGPLSIDVRILDESAGGFAVALLRDEEVQQNQVLVLKTATGTFHTRVARIEQFDDGKLLGLMRLGDLSEAPKKPQAQTPAWRDQLFEPPKPKYSTRGLAMGVGVAIVMMLGCGLVAYRHWPAPAQQAAAPIVTQPVNQPAEAVNQAVKSIEPTSEVVKIEEPVGTDKQPGAVKSAKPAPVVRRKSKTSPEVLYRLHLDSEQSRRIRQILSRMSGTAAEEEIRSVLTPEQASQWQKLAP